MGSPIECQGPFVIKAFANAEKKLSAIVGLTVLRPASSNILFSRKRLALTASTIQGVIAWTTLMNVRNSTPGDYSSHLSLMVPELAVIMRRIISRSEVTSNDTP
ncbi:hypothetical protein PAXRUDRAFT_824665 [Paxillus rubicundulus Ve08.2h10]|uniref:Uncharacterized protein n=1 Tax=Paxillus rubicundulus Ve08.2h10 TaxID=930991 RepID=A0A0D0DHI5_9AGAM|nr:hypothetical protein PAXRUDRAFT_824665 [Paxillus rubicundulus Ve08.2h10]